jgi:hypothetical protein
MAWSTGLYSATVMDAYNKSLTTGFGGITADTINVALFGNVAKTPDKTVTSANTAYNAGVWNADGISDTTNWPAVGRPLVNDAVTNAAGVFKYDADDTVSNTDATTLAAVYGCLVYDDTVSAVVADQGLSFHSFGGSQGVTAGRFTVVWNASGIFTVTV